MGLLFIDGCGCDASVGVVNCADEEGWAPLHSAASIGSVEIVETLLSKGRSMLFIFFITIFVIHDLNQHLFLFRFKFD